MLPPPTTTATCTPCSRPSPTCSAMRRPPRDRCRTGGCPSAPRRESFSSTRRGGGVAARPMRLSASAALLAARASRASAPRRRGLAAEAAPPGFLADSAIFSVIRSPTVLSVSRRHFLAGRRRYDLLSLPSRSAIRSSPGAFARCVGRRAALLARALGGHVARGAHSSGAVRRPAWRSRARAAGSHRCGPRSRSRSSARAARRARAPCDVAGDHALACARPAFGGGAEALRAATARLVDIAADSSRARLQSMIPAPVCSRSRFTSSADHRRSFCSFLSAGLTVRRAPLADTAAATAPRRRS